MENNYGPIILLVSLLSALSVSVVLIIIFWRRITNLFNFNTGVPDIFIGGANTVNFPVSQCMESQANATSCCSPGGAFYEAMSRGRNSLARFPEDKRPCLCIAGICNLLSKEGNAPELCNNYMPFTEKTCNYNANNWIH